MSSKRLNTPARRDEARSSILLLVCLLVAAAGIHVLLRGAAWWGVLALVLTVVISGAAVIRYFLPGGVRRRRFLASLSAAFLLVASCTLFFAPGKAIFGVIPSAGTLEQFGLLIEEANRSIYRQAVPADADTPIVFLLCAGIGSIAVLADLIALTFRSPALAGLPLLMVLGVPVVIGRNLVDLVVFVATACAYLLLLSRGMLRGRYRSAVGISAAAVVAALVVPQLVPAVIPTDLSSARAVVTGVNPVITLGNDLRQAAEQHVITYSSASGEGHYLRLVSLENFNGDRWAPTKERIDRANTVDRFSVPPGLASDVPRSPERTTITVGALSSRWLPAPYPPTRITGVSRDWFFDSQSFSVASPNISARNQSYTVESVQVKPTPEQLLVAGTTVPTTLRDYLALPVSLPGIISSTAQAVAASSTSNYAKAIALQQFFRNGEFSYSEQAPVVSKYDGTGMAVIARFLEAKSGYCVHFASSMAVMARSLGIPARVAVGFLPGRAFLQNEQRSFEVSTKDLHAWPELYFEGVGWVQFEPTPGRGSVSDYANIFLAGVPTPPAPDSSVRIPAAPAQIAAQSPLSRPSPSASASRAVGTGVASPTPTIGLGALTLLALLSIIPFTIRAVGRRRLLARLRSSRSTAVDAWREVMATAIDLRLEFPQTGTPQTVANALARWVGGENGGAAALGRLLKAVETEAFAGAKSSGASVLARDLSVVRELLLRGVPLGPRLVRTLLPRSLAIRSGVARALFTRAPKPMAAAARAAQTLVAAGRRNAR